MMKLIFRRWVIVAISMCFTLVGLPAYSSCLTVGQFELRVNSSDIVLDCANSTNSGILSNPGSIDNQGNFENKPNSVLLNSGYVENNNYFENNSIITNSGNINNFEIFNNSNTINNNGELINNKDFRNYDHIDNQGTIINWDVFQNFGGNIDNSNILNNFGIFNNFGSIENSLYFRNFNIMNNFGFIDNNFEIEILGTFRNVGDINNNGTIFFNNGSSFLNIEMENSNHILNDGSVTIQGDFTNSGVIENHGDLNGVANITGNGSLVNSGGTLAPGFSPGLLTIEGNIDFIDAAVLSIELGGIVAGDEYDVLDVYGVATLEAGTILDLISYDGFIPLHGAFFDVLVADELTLTLSNLDFRHDFEGLGWDLSIVDLDFGRQALRLTADFGEPALDTIPAPPSLPVLVDTPTPLAMLLSLPGLLGLARHARRRKA